MPTYHYACSSCSNEFDKYQSFSEDTLTVCPSCDGFIRRVIQPVGVVFKGTGWYLTDSRKPEKSEATVTSAKDSSADASKNAKETSVATSETPKAESAGKKSEPTTTTKSVESKSAATTAP